MGVAQWAEMTLRNESRLLLIMEGHPMMKRIKKLIPVLLLSLLMTGCYASGPQTSPTFTPGAELQTEIPAKPIFEAEENLPPLDEKPSAAQPAQVNISLVEAYPHLTFDQPLEYRIAGDGSNRIFVVEKPGRILVFPNDPQVEAAEVFLDVTSLVDSNASEKGLLGLAFHPDYENNGYFFINYTDRNNTIIARYQVDPANPNRALPNSASILLTFSQPYENHNGGHIDFGPDGYLYIATGDGGSAGDPQKNAQNRGNLLGKILRIDVDNPARNLPYGIPADNPFTGNTQGWREEIYAYGLRNPWKFSFDQQRGWLWAADVGQDRMEEIDIIESGANYGWNIMEGSLCYPASSDCNQEGLKLPVWEYAHPIGEAITGGYVYYGNAVPNLYGAYVYGDYETGLIWALWLDSSQTTQDNRLLMDTDLNISSFGVDQNNELYVVDLNGKIYRITAGPSA